jgi:hypothetical protein
VTTPNVFQQAAQQAAPQSPAPAQQPAAEASNLAGSFAGPSSQLFGGVNLPPVPAEQVPPVGDGAHRHHHAAPYDVHSRDFNSKKAKYWPESPLPDGKKISFEPLDHITGQPLRKVLDTVIELATDYRFDAAESAALARDPNLPDDGSRAFYVSGDDLKQIRREIARLGGIQDEKGMIGLRLTVKRVGQKPNQGANPSWINTVTLARQ